MKNILLTLATFTILTACNSKTDLNSDSEETTIRSLPLYGNSVYSDTAKTEVTEENSAKPAQSLRKSSVIKRNVNVAATHRNPAPVYTSEATTGPRVVTLPDAAPPVATAPVTTSPKDNTASPAGVGSNESTTATTIPQPEKKKGWSKAAKGAVIGAGAGAIGGIILSKKKGLGAIVGGVVGAAGGYAIGKGMDKKDNRFIAN